MIILDLQLHSPFFVTSVLIFMFSFRRQLLGMVGFELDMRSSGPVVELLLDYLYTGRATASENEAVQFLELGRSLQLRGLVAPVVAPVNVPATLGIDGDVYSDDWVPANLRLDDEVEVVRQVVTNTPQSNISNII